jgi:hypothetical protein
MDVTITEYGERRIIELREPPAFSRVYIGSEHGLRDIEFALAQRRAMSRRCQVTQDEHTCSLAPDHGQASHLCRACTHTWPTQL